MSKSDSSSNNKGRVIQLIVIIVSLCAIIGEVVYIAGGFGRTEAEQNQAVVENVNNTALSSVETQAAENADRAADASGSREYKKYVFVGDSRYVGMSTAVKAEEDTYIAKNNMGYSYLEEQMSLIKTSCDKDTALIIGLGVNDLKYSGDKYIATINQMAQDMDCQIYYVLVNPVDETKEAASGYSVENTKIDEFNTRMKTELSSNVKIIDTNSYLKQKGYTTQDGLHYDTATYKLIYDYIKENL